MGYSVMQIGCDPKCDSTRMLLKGERQKTILDMLRTNNLEKIKLEDIMQTGFNGVKCIEAGGPEPGIGCAGRGVIKAIQLLEELGAYKEKNDFVFYDVLGDVVCGGFAMPIREGYAKEIYLVTSGELMSLYAANNICKCIRRFAQRSDVKLAGLIGNAKNVKNEKKILETFAKKIGTQLIEFIPKSDIVQSAENNHNTVMEYAPNSNQAKEYYTLASKIVKNKKVVTPKNLKIEELEKIVYKISKTGAQNVSH